MSYCVQCGVKLADYEKDCPLCATPVYNPNEIRNIINQNKDNSKTLGKIEYNINNIEKGNTDNKIDKIKENYMCEDWIDDIKNKSIN